MTAKDFLEKYRGVRRTILVIVTLWATAAVIVGCYQVLFGGLGQADSWFLTTVLAAAGAIHGVYFHSRGKQS